MTELRQSLGGIYHCVIVSFVFVVHTVHTAVLILVMYFL